MHDGTDGLHCRGGHYVGGYDDRGRNPEYEDQHGRDDCRPTHPGESDDDTGEEAAEGDPKV
jgi:hypothetical protein